MAITHRKRSRKRKVNPFGRKRTRRTRKHNPVTKTMTYNPRKRGHRRHRRHNPDLSIGGGISLSNIAVMGGSAIAGGVSVAWAAQYLQLTGYMKYLVMIGISVAGWWLLNKVGFKAGAVTFAAGGLGVTGLTFAKENALLQGLLGNLDTPTYADQVRLNQAGEAYASGLMGAYQPGLLGAYQPGLMGNNTIFEPVSYDMSDGDMV